MKYSIALAVCLLTLNSLFGQATKCCIPMENSKDTAFWYKWSRENAEKIGLEDLTRTNDSLHFRFWTETKSVDVWTKDFKLFSGFLSLYTESVPKDVNSTSTGKFYSKKINFNNSTAKSVYLLFDSLSVLSIPVQERIKGWESGNDGDIVLIEYSNSNAYSFKSYWTPSYYPNIKEAVIVDTLSKRLDSKLAMGSKWSKFIHSLPKGSYTAGGAAIVLTDISVKEKK